MVCRQMILREKLKLIRKFHKFTQSDFAEFIAIPLSTYKKYELGASEVAIGNFFKITEKFPQYSLWLSIGEVAPESGQISPDQEVPKMVGSGVPVSIVDDAFDKTIETSVVLGWLTPKEGIEFSMLSDLHRHNFVEAGGVLLEQDSAQGQSKAG